MSRLSEGPFSGAVFRGLVRQGADAFACNPFRELASLSLHAVLTYPFKTHDVLKRSAFRFTRIRIRGLPPPARLNQNQGASAPRSPKPEYQNQGAPAPRSPIPDSQNQGAPAPRSPKPESGGFGPPLAQARIRGLPPPARPNQNTRIRGLWPPARPKLNRDQSQSAKLLPGKSKRVTVVKVVALMLGETFLTLPSPIRLLNPPEVND